MRNSDPAVLAVDAGGTSIKAAVIAGNQIMTQSCYSIPVPSDGSADDISQAYRMVGQAARELEHRLLVQIQRIAVCIPGPFEYATGRCMMKHKYQTVYGQSLRPWLEDGMGRSLPVRFLHDSTAFLLGACADLPNPAGRRVCGVIIGTGLGFASMEDGTILENPSGGPGISIFSRPYLNGTAEDYISKRGILRRYNELVPGSSSDMEVKTIAEAAFQGDEGALRVFKDTGAHLAAVLQPVLHEHPFELMFLGGAISKSAGLFLPALREGLSFSGIRIEPARDPDAAPLLGAAQYL